MRENKIKGSKSIEGGILVYPRREAPGKWMVMWRTGEGRRYRSFPTLTSANFFASELQQDRRRYGSRPIHALLDAADSKLLQELKQAMGDAKLSDVIQAWREYKARQAGMPFGEMAARFIEMRTQEGLAKFLRTNYTLYLRRFTEKFGSRRTANSFTPQDIREWVSALAESGLSAKTISHHLRTLSMVFNRGMAEGWTNSNPCLAVPSPKAEKEEVEVLSLADARKLFAASLGHRVSLYMALEAFGGLRFSSAVRISPEDINFADRSIVLPAAKHKTGRRHVLEGLPDNLWEWLQGAPCFEDPLWKARPWQMSVTLYNREKRAAFRRAGVRLMPNVLRHSFCSYHVAQHQDAAKTALLMQHANQSMLYRHYKGVATRADAGEYFAITPASAASEPCAGVVPEPKKRGRPPRPKPASEASGDVSANPA